MPPELILCRVSPNGPLRTATYQGQAHLVVPVVALRTMVVNTHLASAEAIHRSTPYWNGIPIVVGHPQNANGLDISINASPIVAEQIIGRLFNCTFRQGRLRGEMWINLQTAEQLGGEIWEAVQALHDGEPMDVSTGFFAEVDETEGTYEGRAYTGAYQDIRPDHLALLPHAVGACSWADGCGAPRVNAAEAEEPLGLVRRFAQALHTLVGSPQTQAKGQAGENTGGAARQILDRLRNAGMTYQQISDALADIGTVDDEDVTRTPGILGAIARGEIANPPEELIDALGRIRVPRANRLETHRTDVDIRTALYDLLAQEMGVSVTPIMIQFLDQGERAFVYRQGERVLMRRYAMADDGAITLAADVQSVQLDTRLIPVGETMPPGELPRQSLMDFQAHTLAEGATPVDKTQIITTLLATLQLEGDAPRTQLEALAPELLHTLAERLAQAPKPAEPLPPVQTLQEAMQRLGVAPDSPVFATLQNAVNHYEARRGALLAALKEAKCPLPEAVLSAQSLETLEQYGQMMQLPAPDASQASVSYLGQGAASPVASGLETLEALTPPPVVLRPVKAAS